MKISYHNMPIGSNKFKFILKYMMNIVRTWYNFNIKYPWVQYNGFVRVMPHTSFAKTNITIGNNVQFGEYCNVSSNVQLNNHILIAGRVCFVGRHDHTFNVPKQLIWNGERGLDGTTIVEDDVWIGHNSTIIAGVTIERGAIIAAGSVVSKNIPACEIWGGVPARKIQDRFKTQAEKETHLIFLDQLNR